MEKIETQETPVLDDLVEELKENDFWPIHDIIVYGENMSGDIHDLIEEVKTLDPELAEEIKELSETLAEQGDYTEEGFHVPLRKLADENDFDWYDQYNVRLTAILPSSFDSDMNGAEWRSVDSISEFLEDQNSDLLKLFNDVWYDNFVGQEDIKDIRDEILYLINT